MVPEILRIGNGEAKAGRWCRSPWTGLEERIWKRRARRSTFLLLYAGAAVDAEGQERGAAEDVGAGLGHGFGGRVAEEIGAGVGAEDVGGGQAERGVRAVGREAELVGFRGQTVER